MTGPPEEPVARVVAERIEAIVESAERAAYEFRRQVEAAAADEADNLRQAAEAEVRRIRQEAATQAAEYLQDSRRIVDEFAAQRIAHISAVTDKLIEQTEQVHRGFAHAEVVRRQIYDLIASLGASAEAIAREAGAPDPRLPDEPGAAPGEASSEGIAPDEGSESPSAA
jgi:hypothetical protein